MRLDTLCCGKAPATQHCQPPMPPASGAVPGTEEAVLFLTHLVMVVICTLFLSGCVPHTSELFTKSDEQFLCKDTKKYCVGDFSFIQV